MLIISGLEVERKAQFADELTELFGREVDLVSLRSLHPLLQPSVKKRRLSVLVFWDVRSVGMFFGQLIRDPRS